MCGGKTVRTGSPSSGVVHGRWLSRVEPGRVQVCMYVVASPRTNDAAAHCKEAID
jgi:hypothetical protein